MIEIVSIKQKFNKSKLNSRILTSLLTIVVTIKCDTSTTIANLLSDFSTLWDIMMDQATLSKVKANAVRDDTSRK